MAKENTIKQAYAATVIVDGVSVAPGTAITLPEKEANSIAAMFGILPPTAEYKPAAKAQMVDFSVLEKALADAQATYDAAQALVNAGGNGDSERKVLASTESQLVKLQKATGTALGNYQSAEAALKADGSGEKEAKAFENAEKALDDAEKAEAEAVAARDAAEVAFKQSGASAKDIKALEAAKKALDSAQDALFEKAKSQ